VRPAPGKQIASEIAVIVVNNRAPADLNLLIRFIVTPLQLEMYRARDALAAHYTEKINRWMSGVTAYTSRRMKSRPESVVRIQEASPEETK
jgi:hypothetical protein